MDNDVIFILGNYSFFYFVLRCILQDVYKFLFYFVVGCIPHDVYIGSHNLRSTINSIGSLLVHILFTTHIEWDLVVNLL